MARPPYAPTPASMRGKAAGPRTIRRAVGRVGEWSRHPATGTGARALPGSNFPPPEKPGNKPYESASLLDDGR